jgi:hypothetical protein
MWVFTSELLEFPIPVTANTFKDKLEANAQFQTRIWQNYKELPIHSELVDDRYFQFC